MPRAISTACALSISLFASAARADFESWTWVEHRSPLERSIARAPRVWLRGFYDFRLTGRHQGVGLVFARIGPIVEVFPWLSTAINYAAFTSHTPPRGAPFWEQRLEAEATATLRLGVLTLSHRQRLEYRWRERWQHFRYRLQGRLVVVAPRWRVGAYLWEEALIDPNATDASGPAAGFYENRAGIGLTFAVSPAVKIDVGYVLRARQPAQWELDHVVHTSFAFVLRE